MYISLTIRDRRIIEIPLERAQKTLNEQQYVRLALTNKYFQLNLTLWRSD
jgi:hypothetical protein